ncbi:MAG: ABC transporter permease [Actinomycetia bacterium]|nr:ABC transporter permease [Actinomycetes bacterium]
MSAAPAPGAAANTPADDVARPVGAHKWTPYVLLTPGMLWLGVFFIIPTVMLVKMSLSSGTAFSGDGSFTFSRSDLQWSNYGDAWTKYVIDTPIFQKSLIYALIATALTLVIAYPLAYTIAFKSGRWKNFLLVLVIAPFFTSFLLRTNAWQTILVDSGPVVTFMENIGLLDFLHTVTNIPDSWPSWAQIFPDGITDPNRVLATPLAVIVGLAYNFLPFMTLPLYASLERIDIRFIEAATDLYSSAWTAFRKVTFPLSLPGVVAGTLLTFIPAAGDPVNAQLLGSASDAMMGNAIDAQFKSTGNYPLAAALSALLMAVIVAMVTVYVRRAGTEELV